MHLPRLELGSQVFSTYVVIRETRCQTTSPLSTVGNLHATPTPEMRVGCVWIKMRGDVAAYIHDGDASQFCAGEVPRSYGSLGLTGAPLSWTSRNLERG